MVIIISLIMILTHFLFSMTVNITKWSFVPTNEQTKKNNYHIKDFISWAN